MDRKPIEGFVNASTRPSLPGLSPIEDKHGEHQLHAIQNSGFRNLGHPTGIRKRVEKGRGGDSHRRRGPAEGTWALRKKNKPGMPTRIPGLILPMSLAWKKTRIEKGCIGSPKWSVEVVLERRGGSSLSFSGRVIGAAPCQPTKPISIID